MKKLLLMLLTLMLGLSLSTQADDLREAFESPPDAARPGVYWYFMDGNQDREEMTADLEAMAEAGIGKVLYLEVNIGVPRGPVDFMSPEWQDNFAHALETMERLGMEFILGTGPGWAGSGGPWIEPEQSMQHLVGEAVTIEGPRSVAMQLPVPAPLPPNSYSGMSAELLALRDQWYEDVAALAYPAPDGDGARITEEADLKTLKETLPFSIRHTETRFVDMPGDYDEAPATQTLDPDAMINLTDMMQSDGTLTWEAPPGTWQVYRFVARSTGQTTRPAPAPGHGFENDKFNADAFQHQWGNFQAKLLEKVNPGEDGVGWTRIHLDSWEMSSQNWTQSFQQEFLERRGYDPQPFYPAFNGFVVDSLEKTERFLWDMRVTAQELTLENYAEVIKAIAHEHGMLYSNEPYDMNPAGDIDLGSVADIPMCEFWHTGGGHNTVYSCIEAASIAHVMGRSKVEAEAFTSGPPLYFDTYPGEMKNQLDWAFAIGVNSIIFHTYQHQPLGDAYKPGMHMGVHGVNWHRNQNWWDMLPAFHEYIARSSHLLRQGAAVADILYLTPEGAPHIFLPPDSALEGPAMIPDKKGYAFDAVTPRILADRAYVDEDGAIAFPGGSRYRLLVLPDTATMTLEFLALLAELIQDGATVVGNPPSKSPSLVNYPESDTQVSNLAREIWGALEVPETESVRHYGDGAIYWGGVWSAVDNPAEADALYPHYDATAAVLQALGVREDFTDSANALRFMHRQTDSEEIYFVSNRTEERQDVEAVFRVTGMAPALWHPESGETRPLPQYSVGDDSTTIPLRFEPYESYFVVFSEASATPTAASNFQDLDTKTTLEGAWTVAFDPEWGGPGEIEFPELIDWRDHEERGVQYYSGTAVYRKTFDMPEGVDLDQDIVLDLGAMYEMARVTLNGEALGVVWTAPYQIALGSALNATGNELLIEVANSWENRLQGDRLPPDNDVRTIQWETGLLEGATYTTGRYTFTTLGTLPERPLQPSGLIGPVTLKVRAGE